MSDSGTISDGYSSSEKGDKVDSSPTEADRSGGERPLSTEDIVSHGERSEAVALIQPDVTDQTGAAMNRGGGKVGGVYMPPHMRRAKAMEQEDEETKQGRRGRHCDAI